MISDLNVQFHQIDVPFVDRVVGIMSTGSPPEIKRAQAILTKFQEHPDAWQLVDGMLETAQNPHTKYFALQILQVVINSRWKILPLEQRLAIRDFIVNFIIHLSKDESTLRSQKVLVHKLNHTLVQILKQDWPQHWPNFISDLVGSSKTSDALCENNMNILRILSEEIFDFSSGQMTQNKIKQLKETLNHEFALVFEMCQFVIIHSQNTSLLSETLQTLLKFLNWIPLGYIFETKMIEILTTRFLPVTMFRNHAIRCLTEIGSLEAPKQYDDAFVNLFHAVMLQMNTVLPLPEDDALNPMASLQHIPKIFADGTEDDENFIANLAIFFTNFFKLHLNKVESSSTTANYVITAHKYLTGITNVDHKEVFKTCLEYWLWLTEDVYTSWRGAMPAGPVGSMGLVPATNNQRRIAYSQTFSDLRRTVIKKMVKPEEVIIVEDENGEITKEFMPDVDAQQLYHTMRELLVFLCHLDPDDTEIIMLDKLCAQVDRSEWSWHNLNTLCWAIGSISGAMPEEEEKRFLVAVIKDLLGLCEMMRGKENKAVIASNIMYIVGQYPRFLRAHWKFLRTVVVKLFEFMHESFPGVQEMAVDTFLKICKQCRERFVMTQQGEGQPFIEDLLADVKNIISDLEPIQKHVFWEAVGHMISVADPSFKDALLSKLMEIPNNAWNDIIAKAQANNDNLRDPALMRDLSHIIKSNVRACRAVGNAYIVQFGKLFAPMVELFKWYSTLITQEVSAHGVQATKYSYVRNMRIVKREIVRLIQEFITYVDDTENIAENFLPGLLDAILMDYHDSCPDARDSQVLQLMCVLVNKMQTKLLPEVGRILDATLEVTLQMITKNFEDYPEHRLNFFKLLKELNENCFPSFLAAVQQSKVIMDSVVWAFKHTERNIGDTGLSILLEFLRNVLLSPLATPFYQVYFLSIMNDIFAVLTDTLHKTGFKLQCAIIQHLVQVVAGDQINAPLARDQPMENVPFVQNYLLTLFCNFPNLSRRQIEIFIKGLFELKDDAQMFRSHVRDFLIQLKEFASQDNTDLYDDEREAELQRKKEMTVRRHLAVPGLQQPVPPNARDVDGEMMD